MTADQIKALLGLTPHPREGGCYVRTYESDERIKPASFSDARYGSARRTGTAIYYLLEPDTFSEMHVLASDEIFHFYGGDSVEQLQLFADGSGRTVTIGMGLEAGERPQVIVPRGVWQGARLKAGGKWCLLGCTVSPGFEFEDYAGASRVELTASWPEWAEEIKALTREG